MEFSNDIIDVSLLPSNENEVFTPLQKSYLKLRLISTTIVNLLIISALCVVVSIDIFNLPNFVVILLSSFVLIRLIWSYYKTIKAFHYKSYILREKDISYSSGWIWRSIITVPFNRVQHIQIDRGPLERKMDLARLKIFTAGGQSSDISIPGLRPSEALRIKKFIVSKTSDEEE